MNKKFIAMMVAAVSFTGISAANAGSSTSVSGGTVNFVGEVVDAACAVSAGSINQTVTLAQVRTARLATPGQAAGQKQPFNIVLEDCDTSVSQNAGVTFNGQSDATATSALANTAGAGAASHVALQLYGPDGKELALGTDSSTITLIDGTNTIPLSVDYVSTDAATTPGNVAATATFNVNYN